MWHTAKRRKRTCVGALGQNGGPVHREGVVYHKTGLHGILFISTVDLLQPPRALVHPASTARYSTGYWSTTPPRAPLHRLLFIQPSTPRGPVQPPLHGHPSTVYYSSSPPPHHGVLFNHPSTIYCSSSPPPHHGVLFIQRQLHRSLFIQNLPQCSLFILDAASIDFS